MRYFRVFFYVASILLVANGCKQKEGSTQAKDSLFVSMAGTETGIDFKNAITENAETEDNILSYPYFFHGGGVAVGDINNDGLADVFFTANQGPNKLYLNQGNLKFKDISATAGIGKKNWSTGVTMADVNNDGFLDIYVVQGGNMNNPETRSNLLFINNGNLTFTEKATEYGLDDKGIGTQASFFDMDKDGDLDCYVMNESKYEGVVLHQVFQDLKNHQNLLNASGKLYRNDGNKYLDITEQAGVVRYGYGLGLVTTDLNNDGWTDIYVANDYSVPDFMFINNKNGTFTDMTKQMTRQIEFYGMGVDVNDINNDGLPDIGVVDMATDDHFMGKTLMTSMDVKGFWYYIDSLKYQYQYMFNALQLNNGNNTFSNIANLAHVAKSEWSWASLFFDADNDGFKDYFISNGFKRYARDNDFRNEMERIRKENGGSVPMSMRKEMYEKMPSFKLSNYMGKNNGHIAFDNVAEEWGLAEPSWSNGAAYGDLDNDGDLDLLVNNIDDEAFVYKNTAADRKENNFLNISLKHDKPTENTKVYAVAGNDIYSQELCPTRGYCSAMDRKLHFGLGKLNRVDALYVQWPDGKTQKLSNVKANQLLELKYTDASNTPLPKFHESAGIVEKLNPESVGLDFVHKENPYNDFATEVLLPHKQSTIGPKLTKGDANGDGLEDLYIGGAANQSGVLYLQTAAGKLVKSPSQPWDADKACEDMDAVFFDIDGDGDNDLYVVSGGGGEMANYPRTLQDRLYINEGKGQFVKANGAVPEDFFAGSRVKAADFDSDGDIDLFVAGRAVAGKYPYPDRSMLLMNDKGKLKDVTAAWSKDLMNPGIVTDFIWTDFNKDKKPDLVLVGEWMGIRFYENKGNSFVDVSTAKGTADTHGWWYSIAEADVDNDGDMDLIAGNVGLNTKFKAKPEKPFTVYSADFDGNGTNDIVLTKDYKGKVVPVRGRQCSSEQMPFIKERFKTYKDFANADIGDILGDDKLDKALKLTATEFASVLFINENGKYSQKNLNIMAQIAPVNAIITQDLNEDGNTDIIISGNNFDTEVETQRYDAGTGLILLGDGKGNFEPLPAYYTGFYADGNTKDMILFTLGSAKTPYLLLANNNSAPELFRLNNKKIQNVAYH